MADWFSGQQDLPYRKIDLDLEHFAIKEKRIGVL